MLQPYVLPLMAELPGAIFQPDNTRQHTARMSQDCLLPITFFPGLLAPQICHQLSISEIIWDGNLGTIFFHLTYS
ncbi:hypothetical protein TNCV_3229831 [Trichonephila clavipes]|nr:hypothetical protein TNCV_3229831 [Trichonephila clavipes]